MGVAIADLCVHLGWGRVGIITESLAANTPSPWSDESAQYFEDAHVARGGSVLRPPSSLLPQRDVCEAAGGQAAAQPTTRALLQWAVDAGIKVLFLPMSPDCNRGLFAEIAASGLLFGEGHAFLVNWVSDSILYNIDGTVNVCLLYTSPSPRDLSTSRMPSSA